MPTLTKDTFNRLSAQFHFPFLITGKVDNTSTLTPQDLEFTSLTAHPYVHKNRFTSTFLQVYRDMVEAERYAQVAMSLGSCRTIVQTRDLSTLPVQEKTMLKYLIRVSKKIESLYMKQLGTDVYFDAVSSKRIADPFSYRFFMRNHGPTSDDSNNPLCNALPNFEKPTFPIYPHVLLDDAFFKELNKDKSLSSPWTVVTIQDGQLISIPYHIYYKKEMESIARNLDKSADAIEGYKHEQPLYEYLRAAADAFRTGDWPSADVKWVAMNMHNSKYALRVAPDETYWAPGNLKAGFEFWLAFINPHAALFSDKIKPFIQEMENHLHELVPTYNARTVTFDLPDFIEMILRSGDHRTPTGAVIGQKLPNFTDKMSRMVVMTNYDNVPELKDMTIEIASSIFTNEVAKRAVAATTPITTLLHEMTHSLGVSASVFLTPKFDDKGEPLTTMAALGGTNSQIMEELKAQTGALYWIGWLKDRNIFTEEEAKQYYYDCIRWAFGHIGRGMVDSSGAPKTYSQLAAIQMRHLINAGALTLQEGKFDIVWDKLRAAITELFKITIEIQVNGDKERAEALRADICGGEGYQAIQGKRVEEIYAQFPQTTYDLKLKGI